MCLVQHIKVHFHCISAKSTNQSITKQTGNTNSAQKNTKYCLIFTLEMHKCKKTKTKVKKKKKLGAKYVIMYFNFDISSHRLQFTQRAFPDTDVTRTSLFSLLPLFHCMVRHSTVHFWGFFHWVQYLVPFFSTTSLLRH